MKTRKITFIDKSIELTEKETVELLMSINNMNLLANYSTIYVKVDNLKTIGIKGDKASKYLFNKAGSEVIVLWNTYHLLRDYYREIGSNNPTRDTITLLTKYIFRFSDNDFEIFNSIRGVPRYEEFIEILRLFNNRGVNFPELDQYLSLHEKMVGMGSRKVRIFEKNYLLSPSTLLTLCNNYQKTLDCDLLSEILDDKSNKEIMSFFRNYYKSEEKSIRYRDILTMNKELRNNIHQNIININSRDLNSMRWLEEIIFLVPTIISILSDERLLERVEDRINLRYGEEMCKPSFISTWRTMAMNILDGDSEKHREETRRISLLAKVHNITKSNLEDLIRIWEKTFTDGKKSIFKKHIKLDIPAEQEDFFFEEMKRYFNKDAYKNNPNNLSFYKAFKLVKNWVVKNETGDGYFEIKKDWIINRSTHLLSEVLFRLPESTWSKIEKGLDTPEEKARPEKVNEYEELIKERLDQFDTEYLTRLVPWVRIEEELNKLIKKSKKKMAIGVYTLDGKLLMSDLGFASVYKKLEHSEKRNIIGILAISENDFTDDAYITWKNLGYRTDCMTKIISIDKNNKVLIIKNKKL